MAKKAVSSTAITKYQRKLAALNTRVDELTQENKLLRSFIDISQQGYEERMENKECTFPKDSLAYNAWMQGALRAHMIKQADFALKVRDAQLKFIIERKHLSPEELDVVLSNNPLDIMKFVKQHNLSGKLTENIQKAMQEYGKI